MASSQYNPSWSPERSRLNYYENAWTPAEDSNKEWIQACSWCRNKLGLHSRHVQIISICQSHELMATESHHCTKGRDRAQDWISYRAVAIDPVSTVDLGFLRFVSAIGTQGAVSQETRKIYYLKTYKVDVSSNGEDWITLKEGSKQKAGDSIHQLICDFKTAFAYRGPLRL
ncbi:Neuropilin-1 [Liparis tanakae]|uniref:Neuropilin-1 n=1 Tax=Liparis tanakae TaxID=230148 RepID=A0A4Z2I358_9TELE|nr:Neuropilin-1 [Liparis tanakae]